MGYLWTQKTTAGKKVKDGGASLVELCIVCTQECNSRKISDYFWEMSILGPLSLSTPLKMITKIILLKCLVRLGDVVWYQTNPCSLCTTGNMIDSQGRISYFITEFEGNLNVKMRFSSVLHAVQIQRSLPERQRPADWIPQCKWWSQNQTCPQSGETPEWPPVQEWLCPKHGTVPESPQPARIPPCQEKPAACKQC